MTKKNLFLRYFLNDIAHKNEGQNLWEIKEIYYNKTAREARVIYYDREQDLEIKKLIKVGDKND